MTQTTDTRTLLASETYLGRELTVERVECAATDYCSARSFLDLRIDGSSVWGKRDVAACLKRGRDIIDGQVADAAILPACRAACRTLSDAEAEAAPLLEAAPELGATVALYSRGRYRVGVVEKVGRTNATVAYTTPQGADGLITRKSVAFGKLLAV